MRSTWVAVVCQLVAVPGATITATNVETSVSRRTVSSAAGVDALPTLLPGLFRVGVELAGFRTARREGVRIETGTTTTLDVEPAVGDLSESVTVTAAAPMLRRVTGSLGEVVSESEIVAHRPSSAASTGASST